MMGKAKKKISVIEKQEERKTPMSFEEKLEKVNSVRESIDKKFDIVTDLGKELLEKIYELKDKATIVNQLLSELKI